MNKSRFTLVVVAASLLFLPAIAAAEGGASGPPPVLVPDGRITSSTIPAATTFFFKISSRVGSSYSAEFHNVLGAAVQTPGTLGVFSDVACGAAVTTTNTGATDPGDLNGERRSFTATTVQTLFSLNNATGSPITYSFSVSDTTMFSPAWSTNGTFDSFYSFLNTTGGTIAGTLTLYNTAGVQVGTPANFTINPNNTARTNSVLISAPRNNSGTATFTHNQPPRAILAEAEI